MAQGETARGAWGACATVVTDRDLKGAVNRLTGNHLAQPAQRTHAWRGATEVQVQVTAPAAISKPGVRHR